MYAYISSPPPICISSWRSESSLTQESQPAKWDFCASEAFRLNNIPPPPPHCKMSPAPLLFPSIFLPFALFYKECEKIRSSHARSALLQELVHLVRVLSDH